MLQVELTEQSIRSIRYQINAARFPIHHDLQGFDFSQPKVNEQLINQLTTMEFTAATQNLVLVGSTGTGKTHLATAIGISGYPVSQQKSALLLYRRSGQYAGTRESRC